MATIRLSFRRLARRRLGFWSDPVLVLSLIFFFNLFFILLLCLPASSAASTFLVDILLLLSAACPCTLLNNALKSVFPRILFEV